MVYFNHKHAILCQCLNAYGSFSIEHVCIYKSEIEKQTIIVIRTQKMAATSALSSNHLALSPGYMIYFRLGRKLFVFITDLSQLAKILH